MEPKYKPGDRVLMFGTYKGTVKYYNPHQMPFYTVICDYCANDHQLWEEDMIPLEEVKHEPVGN